MENASSIPTLAVGRGAFMRLLFPSGQVTPAALNPASPDNRRTMANAGEIIFKPLGKDEGLPPTRELSPYQLRLAPFLPLTPLPHRLSLGLSLFLFIVPFSLPLLCINMLPVQFYVTVFQLTKQRCF